MAFRRDALEAIGGFDPQLPRRRRRRRRLLAAAGARLDARLQPRRRWSGTTAARSAPTCGSSGLRRGRGAAGSASGRSGTTARATRAGRARLRRRPARCRSGPARMSTTASGDGPVPVALPAGPPDSAALPCARRSGTSLVVRPGRPGSCSGRSGHRLLAGFAAPGRRGRWRLAVRPSASARRRHRRPAWGRCRRSACRPWADRLLCTPPAAARLRGRLEYGLTPWRRRRAGREPPAGPGHIRFWCEHWQPPEMWLDGRASRFAGRGVAVAAVVAPTTAGTWSAGRRPGRPFA